MFFEPKVPLEPAALLQCLNFPTSNTVGFLFVGLALVAAKIRNTQRPGTCGTVGARGTGGACGNLRTEPVVKRAEPLEPTEPVMAHVEQRACIIAHQRTGVLLHVPLQINQQWEPWSFGSFVFQSFCLPIVLEPFCLPSSLHLVSHHFVSHYPFILSLFSFSPFLSVRLVSDHPFVLSLITLSPIVLCPILTSPTVPASAESLEAERPAHRLGPRLLAMCRVPHHFVSRHFFIVSLFVLFPITPSPAIPASPTTESSCVESLEAGGR